MYTYIRTYHVAMKPAVHLQCAMPSSDPHPKDVFLLIFILAVLGLAIAPWLPCSQAVTCFSHFFGDQNSIKFPGIDGFLKGLC